MSERHGPPTEVLPAGGPGVLLAAEYLVSGELVAFPTETVYGLGADATNERAVVSVFTAKGRPSTDPLIVHVADLEMAHAIGDMSAGGGLAQRLAGEFWPGPLTVVVPRRSREADDTAAGDRMARRRRWELASSVSMGSTVGLRCPSNHVALELIDAAGVPLAAPSANRFGRVSPTTAAHVLEELGGRIRAVLDGGATTLGVESTVVGFEGDRVRVLRPGGVPVEDLRAVLPPGCLASAAPPVADPGAVAESPGTSISHYAPDVPLVFTDGTPGLAERLCEQLRAAGLAVCHLELPAVDEAARTLYSVLRELDSATGSETSPDVAVVAALEPAGLGRAVNDRLLRAAHGHIYADADRATVRAIIDRIGRFGG